MGTRITSNTIFRTSLSGVAQQRLRLARTQEQASSGLRINRLSDDPVGVRAATLLKAGLEATDQFQRNIARAHTRVGASEAALADANEVLVRARELALQGANGTLGPDERRDLAAEVEGLHGQLLAAANSRAGGGYLFAGYAGDTQPFAASGAFASGSPHPTVAFGGDASEIQLDIDEGVRVAVTLDGQRVFLGDGDGDGSPDAGREDLFEVLGDLRDALDTDDLASIQSAVDRIDAARKQVSAERTRVGATDTQLERFDERLALRHFDLTARLSDVQDADSIQVFSDLVSQEAALSASLEVASRIVQPTLLDFLA